MAGFPDEQLELYAEIAPGADLTADPSTWAWTVLTCPHPANPSQTISRIVDDSTIAIKRGIAVGGSQQQTTSASLQLLNVDGALTPELVTSPYWPYVDAGTPFRLRMRSRTTPYLTDTFGRTVSNGWGTTTTGGYTWTPGTASQYNVGSGVGTITFTAKADASKAIKIPASITNVEVLFDCSVNTVALGVANIIGATLREDPTTATWVWAHLDFNIGGTIDCHIRESRNGAVSNLTQATQPALTYTAGTMIRSRIQLTGNRVRMRAWLASGTEPSTWTIDHTISVTEPGTVLGVRSEVFSGNLNTLPVIFTVDNITVSQAPADRLEGYIADIKPRFLPQSDGTTWSTVQVEVAGVGSRLEKKQSPSYSPLRRSVQLAPVPPLAYWPLEDDEGSSFGASAYPGGPSMLVSGPAVFSFSQGTPVELYLSRYGTKPLVSVAAGARLSAVVPTSAVTTQWAVSVVADFYAPEVPGITEMRIAQWDTPSGTWNRWALVAPVSGGYIVRAYNDSTSTTTDVTLALVQASSQVTYTIEAEQSGGNINVRFYIVDNLYASGSVVGTQAPITRLVLNPDKTNTTNSVTPRGLKFVVGHARVVEDVNVHDTPYYTVPESGEVVSAIFAWFDEPAHRRLGRLCTEERIPFEFVGDPATTGMTLLNAQQDGAFSDLLTAATEAESGGLLYEARYGYRYLPRTTRYNAPVALLIDMAAYRYSDGTDPGEVLSPTLDTRAANYWTIGRTNGSTQSYAASEEYRTRRGTIAEQRTLDVLTDDVLLDHAGWRTHLSIDGRGANYPSVLLDLAANPDLIDAWLACDLGSRVQRLNQPTIAGAGTIDQVIEGITETISPGSWDVVIAASPGSVWDVALWDDPTSLWASSLTTLSAPGLNTTALSFVMSGETWTTGAVSLLLDIDGEQMTATNITGTGPYTVTLSARHVNGLIRSHTAGAAVTLAVPDRWAL